MRDHVPFQYMTWRNQHTNSCLLNLRFSQQLYWRAPVSGMWRHVVRQMSGGTSVNFQWVTQHHIPEHSTLQFFLYRTSRQHNFSATGWFYLTLPMIIQNWLIEQFVPLQYAIALRCWRWLPAHLERLWRQACAAHIIGGHTGNWEKTPIGSTWKVMPSPSCRKCNCHCIVLLLVPWWLT
jgi:hypothetical protein